MDYIGIEETAKKWGTSKRFVQLLCSEGRIEGATRLGRAWMIPKDARKPMDGRTKAAKTEAERDMPLPRRTPFLYIRIPDKDSRGGFQIQYHRPCRGRGFRS